jgi:hypothetical protein
MARGGMGAASAIALLVLACALHLAAVKPAAAGPYDVALPLFNPRYLPPGPEGPWGHVPSCQVLVRTGIAAQAAVTPDDIRYCELPPYASRRASDPCACVLPFARPKVVRSGMVVWRPAWWGYGVIVGR